MSSKERSSEITGRELAVRRRTGTPPSATGSARLSVISSVTPEPEPRQAIPLEVRPIVGAQVASLLESLRGLSNPLRRPQILSSLSSETRAAAVGALAGQLAVAEEFARPCSPQKIGRLLITTAEVFQVDLPSEEGLAIYIAALSAVPERLLIKAVRQVCISHRFKSMPLVADILKPIKDDMWAVGWLIETCKRRIKELS
jgi:hypothetical protein